jgi:DNA-binding MarR family transcriptional regulator
MSPTPTAPDASPASGPGRCELSPSDLDLAQDVRIAIMRLARRLRQEPGQLNLTLTQLSALASLDRHGPLTPGALAEVEKVSPPSMTRVLAALEERGLVVRRPHPGDGRQQIVEVTGQAHDMLAADRRAREAWLACRMAELSEDERAALHAAAPVLAKLVETP